MSIVINSIALNNRFTPFGVVEQHLVEGGGGVLISTCVNEFNSFLFNFQDQALIPTAVSHNTVACLPGRR